MRRLDPTKTVLACFALAAIGACTEEGNPPDRSGEPPIDIISVAEFAPELRIDLEAFERTSTGLYVANEAEGNGVEAETGLVVVAHYTGWLTDGREFDSSRDGDPIEFPLGVGFVIPGWDEGLTGMRAGGRRRLLIPPHHGYGPSGQGTIPPNAILVFDVELLDASRPPAEDLR